MSAPPKWSSIDSKVQAQVERTRELDRRSREASAKAREASEHVAAIEREDQARRASAAAEGAKSDPGRDADKIATAEREATKAAEAAAVLVDAARQASAKLDAVCVERADAWAAAARERIKRAGAELDAAVEVIRASYSLGSSRADSLRLR